MNIRRAHVMVAVALLVEVIPPAAHAATAKPKRPAPKRITHTLMFAYSPAATSHTFVGLSPSVCRVGPEGAVPKVGPLAPCLAFSIQPNMRYMTIKSSDRSGTPTPISLFAKSGAAGESFYCGGVRDRRIGPNQSYELDAAAISIDPSCKGVATTGTITVIMSNLP